MQDLTHKVRTALEVYLYHGQAALASLGEALTEEFFAIMSERETAFQNFCALDAAATAAGSDPEGLPELRRLWQDVDILNRTLYGRMADAQATLATKRRHAPRPHLAASRRAPSLRLIKTVEEGSKP